MQPGKITQEQVREEQELRKLEGIIKSSLAESKIEKSSSLYQDIKNNLVQLILSLKESGASSFSVSGLLVPIINKILTNQNERDLIKSVIAVLNIFKISVTDGAKERLTCLYEICKGADAKNAISKMQEGFKWDCISNAQSFEEEIREQQILWQFQLSNRSKTDPQYDLVVKSVKEMDGKAQIAKQNVVKVTQFCEQYEVRPGSWEKGTESQGLSYGKGL